MAACAVACLRPSRRRQTCRIHQSLPGGPAARTRPIAQPRTVTESASRAAPHSAASGGNSSTGEAHIRRSGMLFGVGAYVWWGLCPGFFPLLLPAGSLEVLAHRIVWSALCLAVVLLVARRFGDLRRLSGRTWLLLLAASALVSANWGTYIYAATHGHVVDAALGYFINPLVTVALGVLVFRERIGRWQLVALVIAVAAVVVLTAGVGTPPYIAAALAVTFALYGLVKKVVVADPRVSVAVEAFLALPLAGGYLIALEVLGHGHFVNHGAL